uniref:Uncharacterized protein n=1 Tax=Oryza glaberrima TaxID=4538 RepID=I1QYY0_ORYGL
MLQRDHILETNRPSQCKFRVRISDDHDLQSLQTEKNQISHSLTERLTAVSEEHGQVATVVRDPETSLPVLSTDCSDIFLQSTKRPILHTWITVKLAGKNA